MPMKGMWKAAKRAKMGYLRLIWSRLPTSLVRPPKPILVGYGSDQKKAPKKPAASVKGDEKGVGRL